MAILGAQLVITLVTVSIIQKVTPYFSFGQWLLCSTGLVRYLYPTDNELKTLAGVPKTKPKKDNPKAKNGYDIKSDTFHVPRSLDLQLESTKISPFEVVQLRYYTEYQWLVDFSLYTAVVYIISEMYHSIFPLKDEINLSMMWCMLVVLFAFKLLVSLTVQYFQSEESIGERSTCIVTGLVYFLLAMIILIVPERILETGLEKAYSSFNSSASAFLEKQGVNSAGPASRIVVLFCIAVTCGILGAIFTFPGLRMARMQWDSLKNCENNKPLQFLLHANFALPFILVILWIKPVTRDYLTSRVFSGMSGPLLSEHLFETGRLVLIIAAVVIRLALMPIYLQSYLNLAYQRVEELKKEAGRITNIELQRKISSIFHYLCVVTVQYVAPILLCLYLTLMYKTLGNYEWSGLFRNPVEEANECSADIDENQSTGESSGGNNLDVENSSILDAAQNIQLSLQSLKAVFTTDVYRGLFGFATWWSCFVWFAATSIGLGYQTYFSKS